MSAVIIENHELLERVAERFRALGDETRLRLIMRLRQGECNVTGLSRELGIGQASVSKHLSTLRNAGFLSVRREGAQAFYSIRDPKLFEVCSCVCDGILRQHAEAFEALSQDAANTVSAH